MENFQQSWEQWLKNSFVSWPSQKKAAQQGPPRGPLFYIENNFLAFSVVAEATSSKLISFKSAIF